MRKALEAFSVLDAAVTIWWLLQGAPMPSLGALSAPAPAWLWALLWLAIAVLVAGLAAMIGACVRAQLGRG